MDLDISTLLDGEPSEEEQQQALVEALRAEQAKQQAARAGLQEALTRQQGQAGALRSFAMLSSFGDNPLLRRAQQEAGQQGSQLEGLAARTEQRLGAVDGKAMDPLALARLQQGAQRLKWLQDRSKGLAEDADARLALGQERLGLQRQKAAASATAAATKAEEKGEEDLRKEEDRLRRELMGSPASKEFQSVAVAYEKMRGAAGNPSAAGDLNLIFGYMKMLDPGSTVREGEFANAQNAGGVDARVQAAYNKVISGQRLTPAQRQDFLNQARGLYDSQMKGFDRLAKGYKGLAQQRGVNPERVALPLGLDLNEEQPQVAAAPAAVPAPAKPAVNPRDFVKMVEVERGGKMVKLGQRRDGSVVVIKEDGSLEPVTVKK